MVRRRSDKRRQSIAQPRSSATIQTGNQKIHPSGDPKAKTQYPEDYAKDSQGLESIDSFEQEVERVDRENAQNPKQRNSIERENLESVGNEDHGSQGLAGALALKEDAMNDNDPVSKSNMSGMVVGTEAADIKIEDDLEMDIPTESRISKTLSNKTTKVVVMLVLILLFSLPFVQIETYSDPYLLHKNGLEMLVDIYNNEESWEAYDRTFLIYERDVFADDNNPGL